MNEQEFNIWEGVYETWEQAPVDDDVDQDGSACHVEAPDRMVDELEMPPSLSGA